MRTRVKGLLALALTFLAGCTIGVLARECRPEWFSAIRTRHQPPMERAMRHMDRLLDLTPAQEEAVRRIFQSHHAEFMQEIERAKTFRKAFLLRHFEEMEPLLDERQKAVARDFVERHLTDAPPQTPPPDRAEPADQSLPR